MIFHVGDGVADLLHGLADFRDLRHGLRLIRRVLPFFLLRGLDEPCDLLQNSADFLLNFRHILLQFRNLCGSVFLQRGHLSGNVGGVLGKLFLRGLHLRQGLLSLFQLFIYDFQLLLIFRDAAVQLFQIVRSGFHLRLQLVLHALLHFAQGQLGIRLHAPAEKSHSGEDQNHSDGCQRDSRSQQLSPFRGQFFLSFRISAEEFFSVG